MLLVSRKEKEEQVIKLASEGKTTREIAKEVHISLKDIGKIIRKITGDEDPDEKEKEDKQKLKELSPYAQAFQMFKDKKSLVDVAINLDIETNLVLIFHADYLQLLRMSGLVDIYKELKNDWPLFFHFYRRVKKEGLSKQDITILLKSQQDLTFLEKRVELYNVHIQGQQLQKQQLEKEIKELTKKRDT